MLAAAAACVAVVASAQVQVPVSEAQFRGCDEAGCRFRIESSPYVEEAVLRVRPDGVRPAAGDAARALRDRLNALMVDMIHQYKRIDLRNLRALEQGVYGAIVIVDGADVAADAVVLELQAPATMPAR